MQNNHVQHPTERRYLIHVIVNICCWVNTFHEGRVMILNHFCWEEAKPGRICWIIPLRFHWQTQRKRFLSGFVPRWCWTHHSGWSVSCVFAGGTSLLLHRQSKKTLGRRRDGRPLSQRWGPSHCGVSIERDSSGSFLDGHQTFDLSWMNFQCNLVIISGGQPLLEGSPLFQGSSISR